LESKHKSLQETYQDSKEAHDTVQHQYKALQEDHLSLHVKYQKQENDHTYLQERYCKIQDQYYALQCQHDELLIQQQVQPKKQENQQEQVKRQKKIKTSKSVVAPLQSRINDLEKQILELTLELKRERESIKNRVEMAKTEQFLEQSKAFNTHISQYLCDQKNIQSLWQYCIHLKQELEDLKKNKK
jgi:chromosome segregation ATPase